MTKLSLKYLFGMAVILHASLLFFLSITSPHKLPVLLLLLPLIWMFACIVTDVLLVMRLIHPNRAQNKKQLLYAVIIAAVPAGMLLLRSIDQLTFKDLLLISLLTVVTLFYFTRFRFLEKIE